MISRPDIQLKTIPHGYAGTLATVEHVIDLIKRGAKDYVGEIKALFEWVQRNVRYTRDPCRVEVLHLPRRMLALRAGDCDDMSILLGAMLEAIGHSVRVVLTGSNPLAPTTFTHIYIEAQSREPCGATVLPASRRARRRCS